MALQGHPKSGLDTLHDDNTTSNDKLETLHTDNTSAKTVLDAISAALAGAGSIGLTSASVTALETAFTNAQATLHTDLTSIAGDLSDIYGELLQKFEAGELAGLDQATLDGIGQAVATLFHYPTDYPDATTHTKLDTLHTDNVAVETKLDTLHTDLASVATSTNQASANTKLDTLHTDNAVVEAKLDTLHADLSGVSSVANQVSANTKLDTLHTDLTSVATAANQSSANTKLDTIHTDLGAITSTNTKLDTLHTDLTNLATYNATTGVKSASGSQVTPLSANTVIIDWTLVTGSAMLVLLKNTGSASNGNYQIQFSGDGVTADITTAIGRTLTTSTAAPAAATAWTASANSPMIVSTQGKYVRIIAQSSFTGVGTANAYITFVDAEAGLGTVTVDTELPNAAALADTTTNPTTALVGAAGESYNGTNWDRNRNNHFISVDSSSARLSSGNGTTATNHNACGVQVGINVTAVSGTTPTMTVRVQVSYDGTNFVDLDTTNAQTATINATGTFLLTVYPGVTNTANSMKNAPLPRIWRLAWTIGGTTPSFTFVTTAAYIV